MLTLYTFPSAAPIAQSVERFHGKEKVNGSIPFGGSDGKTAGQSGVAQVVEQAAHNRCVAGSTPALATNKVLEIREVRKWQRVMSVRRSPWHV